MSKAEKLVSFKNFLAFPSMVLLLDFRIILEVHFQTLPSTSILTEENVKIYVSLALLGSAYEQTPHGFHLFSA